MMPDLFADFEDVMAADSTVRRRLCGFARWIATMPEGDRVRAEDLLRDETYTCRSLTRYFAAKGATFNDQVVYRHRNRQCCGQKKEARPE